ncbi:hypothetical protein [Thermococcus sp.]|uniref:hypothetical protein n=1 Tax=Thermococcus sp. TaxID=35749 RepID=UPI0026079ECF|nr:hypothetical protein [Thermococcus sp.]
MVKLGEDELRKRIEEMEALLELMGRKYAEMKRDREVLRRAISELKGENAKLKGEADGRA